MSLSGLGDPTLGHSRLIGPGRQSQWHQGPQPFTDNAGTPSDTDKTP